MSNGHISSANGASSTATPATRPRFARVKKVLRVLVWSYLAAMVLAWVWMYAAGDREFLASILLFGPRALLGLPLPLLALLAMVFQPRLLWPLAASLLVIVVGVMGLQVHWPAAASTPVGLRVLTFNGHEDGRMAGQLVKLIERLQPDIIAAQETNYWEKLDLPPPWTVIHYDEQTVASRWPIKFHSNVERPYARPKTTAVRFTVELPRGEIQIFTLHLETPRPGLEAKLFGRAGHNESGIEDWETSLQLRLVESLAATEWINTFPGPKLVMGDFNMPVESNIYRDCWSFLGNAFSTVGLGFGYSKITETMGLHYGTRIDHVLFSEEYRPIRCYLGENLGSDHLPVIAEFE